MCDTALVLLAIFPLLLFLLLPVDAVGGADRLAELLVEHTLQRTADLALIFECRWVKVVRGIFQQPLGPDFCDSADELHVNDR